MTASLSNKILAYLNGFPSGLTFAQIYDGVKPDSNPNLAFCRKVTEAVFEMVCDGLICCNDLFAEASNGATREKQVLYKITHLGKMRLYGLSSTSNILDVAEGSPALRGEGLSSFGSGGGVTAPAISSPPFPIDRFGDDRFADNILRACRNLAQHGDDEEECDAAEEGALIEASGYSDPQHESNGRY